MKSLNIKLIKFNKIDKKINYLYAFFFAMFFSLFYNPLKTKKLSVTKFKRIIGIGIIKDKDVSNRIRNFNIYFLLFLVLFLISLFLINEIRLRYKDENSVRILKFLDKLIVLGNTSIILRAINYFNPNKNGSFDYISYFFMLLMILGLSYIILDFKSKISVSEYLKLTIMNLILGLILSFLFFSNKKFEKVLISLQFFLQIFEILIVKFNFFSSKYIKNTKFSNNIYVYVCSLPLISSIFIELVNILNQYKIFIKNPRKIYTLIIMISFIFWFIITRNKNLKRIENFCYPLLVVGISAMSVQLTLQKVYNPDIFEGANSGILIGEFFNNGSIPIVEHYGGHMMTDVWEGLIYGILNNDKIGAIVSPYAVFFVCTSALLFYLVLKDFLDKENSLIITLFFPFYNFWFYFSIGLLVYFAIKSYVNKPTYIRAIILWMTGIWCTIYRLDLGYVFLLGAFFTLLIYTIKLKKIKLLKQLFITLLVCLILCLILWVTLCVFKGIDPKERLKEFILISLSNQSWAYDLLGNTKTTVFFWSYIFIPFIMLASLVYLILFFNISKNRDKRIWFLLLILGTSYFFNFSRGLVRHSLAELMTRYIIWSAYIFLAIFISYLSRKKFIFLPIYMFFIILDTLFFTPLNFNKNSIFEDLNTRMNVIKDDWNIKKENGKTYFEEIAENKKVVNRVEWDEKLKLTIFKFKKITDILLKKNETYVDFININLLYPILNKKSPVYVSQSPLQLSGEFTQEQYIKQIKNIPIIFMPVGDSNLDGVVNSYRFYKVSEYIYQNYMPLIKYENEFTVWCLKDRCNELKLKLKKESQKNLDILKKITNINYGYDEFVSKELDWLSFVHNNNLEYLPYIWANYDIKKAINNKVLYNLKNISNNRFLIDKLNNNQKIKGNYLLVTGNFKNEEKVTIKLGNLKDNIFSEKYKYNFIAKEGTQNYLLRVSTDYYWYTNEINSVEVVSENGIKNVSMKILEGD